MLKNFCLTFLLLITASLLFPSVSQAQTVNTRTINDYLPGAGCGVPGDTEGRDKCCKQLITSKCPKVPFQDIIGAVPGINKPIKAYEEKCAKIEALQDEAGKISACITGKPSTTDLTDPNCVCEDDTLTGTPSGGIVALEKFCQRYYQTDPVNPDPKRLREQLSCIACVNHGIWTAIGCIPLDLSGLVKMVFGFGLSIAFFISFFCIIASAFRIQTSAGKPETIKKAQQSLTSCILGLLLIIFSVFLLRLIGVDILRIPFITK